ncbi:MAG: dimethyl sulfoxide reductase anchor subunit, partial [Rhodoferax sp.]|nr:dimethyl sulfoxide reductase anchor subunit [Rhodoferax sp.]
MKPAFSVIFLTTLIGAAQGLFLALFTTQSYILFGLLPQLNEHAFYAHGSLIALLFLLAGLAASFLHLGRPERAWRAAAMWRTSWLSREVIVLPAFMGVLFLYGLTHLLDWKFVLATLESGVVIDVSVLLGVLGTLLAFSLATAFAAYKAPELVQFFGTWAFIITLLGFVSRSASLMRNRRLRPKSTVQTAIGIKHPQIVQTSAGFVSLP